jgi:hypothetical protein
MTTWVNIFTQADSVKRSSLESPLNYSAEDSLILNMKKQKAYLYNKAHVDYGDYVLDACYIEFDFSSKIVLARLCLDSLGNKIGVPKLTDGNTITEADSIKFNFESKRGVTYQVRMQEGEGYIHGHLVKRQANGQIHIDTALYTTCNLDHPHYYFKLRKAIIIPDDKIVSGPINLFVADIPTPLGLPFAFLPNKNRERGANGIIIPTYGQSQALGFFLAGGGYYHKFKKERLATALTGDIYSRGSWALKNNTNYKVRYKFDGDFSLSYQQSRFGEPEFPDFQKTGDFFIRWNHKQDPKARPSSNFNISINAGTATNFRNNFGTAAFAPQMVLQNQFNSNVAYSRTFKKLPSNLSVNLRHSQNNAAANPTVTFTLPDVTYSVNRFYPAKWFKVSGITASGARKQLEKIGVTYIANVKNETTVNQNEVSLDNIPALAGNMRNGAKHTFNVNTSLQVFKQRISITPSFNANALMYQNYIQRSWDPSNEVVRTDTTNQFTVPYWYNANINLTTKLYGFYEFADFLQGKRKTRIRHVLTPSANFTARPPNAYEYSYQYSNQPINNTRVGTRYEGAGFIFGGPPTGSSGNINFSLINALEMKQVNQKDTTGDHPFVYKNLLDNFTLTSGYDLYRDSLNWDDLNLSGRTSIGKLAFRFNALMTPYAHNSIGQRINTFQREVSGDWFNLTSGGAAVDWRFESKTRQQQRNTIASSNAGTAEEMEYVRNNPDEFSPFGNAGSWNVNLQYTISFVRNFNEEALEPVNLSQTIGVNGDLNVTEFWKLRVQSNYDFVRKQFAFTTIEVTRNLHCWEMSFNWVPFGPMRSYNISIYAKSSILQDLKLQRRRTWYDNGNF